MKIELVHPFKDILPDVDDFFKIDNESGVVNTINMFCDRIKTGSEIHAENIDPDNYKGWALELFVEYLIKTSEADNRIGVYDYVPINATDEQDYDDSVYDRTHTDEAIKQRGEVFTPTPLVNEMLDKLPREVFTDKSKTFLDNSCGNGQFLSAVLQRKMDNDISHKQALKTIYGVELDPHNAKECRERLLRGSKDMELIKIVENNIICADALDKNHPGWKEVGFYWEQPKYKKFFD